MHHFSISTKAHACFVNITSAVAQAVTVLGLRDGVVTVFIPHMRVRRPEDAGGLGQVRVNGRMSNKDLRTAKLAGRPLRWPPSARGTPADGAERRPYPS
jgi:hypothetical protein